MVAGFEKGFLQAHLNGEAGQYSQAEVVAARFEILDFL